jgi:hypothetical protein
MLPGIAEAMEFSHSRSTVMPVRLPSPNGIAPLNRFVHASSSLQGTIRSTTGGWRRYSTPAVPTAAATATTTGATRERTRGERSQADALEGCHRADTGWESASELVARKQQPLQRSQACQRRG